MQLFLIIATGWMALATAAVVVFHAALAPRRADKRSR